MTGYLHPTTISLQGLALRRFLQQWVLGLSGLAEGALVVPMWQPEPPTEQAQDVDWLSFGIKEARPDATPYVAHGNGVDRMQRHPELKMDFVVYGPNCGDVAQVMADGVWEEQNRYPLQRQGFGLVDVTTILTMAELVNDTKWRDRKDFSFLLRRQVVREYAVGNVESAEIDFNGHVAAVVMHNS